MSASSAKGEMSTENYSEFIFTWQIKNYSYCLQKRGEAIESPEFSAETISNCKWVCLIHPKGCGNFYKNYVRCALSRRQPDTNFDEICIDYTIEILRDDGSVLTSKTKSKHSLKELDCINGIGWPQFVEIDFLASDMKNWRSDDLTLRCRMMCDKKRQEDEAVGCKAVTQVGVNRVIWTWNIRSPSFVQWTEDIVFRIPGISQFNITLNAPGKNLLIRIYLMDASAIVPGVVTVKLTFLTKNGIVIGSNKESYLFDSSHNMCGIFPDFVNKEALQVNTKGLMFYDFTIKGEVIAASGSTISREENYSYIFTSPLTNVVSILEGTEIDSNSTSMQSHFRNLFSSKKFTDVKLRVGEKEFLAHKSVLTARSPVFSVMFDQEMSESKTGVVDIHDVDSDILNKFLEYLYTDTVLKMDYETAKHLLLVADKYEIISLKEKCASFLMSALEVGNACDVSIIADMVNHKCLKTTAFNFIELNASEILPTPEWLNLIKTNAALATEILIKLSKKLGSPMNIF